MIWHAVVPIGGWSWWAEGVKMLDHPLKSPSYLGPVWHCGAGEARYRWETYQKYLRFARLISIFRRIGGLGRTHFLLIMQNSMSDGGKILNCGKFREKGVQIVCKFSDWLNHCWLCWQRIYVCDHGYNQPTNRIQVNGGICIISVCLKTLFGEYMWVMRAYMHIFERFLWLDHMAQGFEIYYSGRGERICRLLRCSNHHQTLDV